MALVAGAGRRCLYYRVYLAGAGRRCTYTVCTCGSSLYIYRVYLRRVHRSPDQSKQVSTAVSATSFRSSCKLLSQ